MIYEGLTKLTSLQEAELAVAESYSLSDDGKTYTFKLKECHWSNGDPLTAFDFERSWKSQLDPFFPSISVNLLYDIVNAKEAKEGLVPLSNVGIQALDDRTLVVELLYPAPYFLELVAFTPFFPVHGAHSKEHISNGPFCMKEEKFQDHILLKPNPFYYHRDEVKLDGIEIMIVKEETTAIKLFENGQVDYIGEPLCLIPFDTIRSMTERLQTAEVAATSRIIFNVTKPPLDNRELRRALGNAIDKKALLEYLPIPTTEAIGIVPSCLKKYPCHPLSFNMEEVKKVVLEKEFPPLKLTYGNSVLNKVTAQILQDQWKKNLGIDIELEGVEMSVFIQKLLKKDYQIVLGKWICQYNDPLSVLEALTFLKDVRNFPGWNNSLYRDLIGEARQTRDVTKRLKVLNEAEDLINEEVPIAPLFHFHYLYMKSERLKDLVISPMGVPHFHKAYISEET